MELHERANGQVVVIDVQGPIERNSEAQRRVLLERLRVLVDQGYTRILLNVAQVTYVDSVLLGAVVQAYMSAVRRGATLKLLNVTKRLQDLLVVTKLDTVLETAESEDVGQASGHRPRTPTL